MAWLALTTADPSGDTGPVLPLPQQPRGPAPSAVTSGQIGRYVVLREIGSGAMGLVLAAYDPDLDRKVALKILREGRYLRRAGHAWG